MAVKITTAVGFAFSCADYPTRILMANMADAAGLATPFVIKNLLIPFFQAAYPVGWEYHIDTLEKNLRLITVTIVINDNEIECWSTLQQWDNQLRNERSLGLCQVNDPPCSRFTISGIGE